jgi:hypothetical protein
MSEWCAYCEEDKEVGMPLDVEGRFVTENNLHYIVKITALNGFICRDCGKAMMESIKKSKVLWKETVLSKG